MAQPAITPMPDVKAAATTIDITSLQSDRAIQGDRASSGPSAIPDFGRVVDDAMLLLTHAAETGVEVDETARTSILNARAAANPNWNDAGAAELLDGLATVASKLRPVTADSLRASYSNLVDPDIQTLRRWTPEVIPAAQYVRMSTDLQQYSIENQKAAIQQHAQRHGFIVVKTYADTGKK